MPAGGENCPEREVTGWPLMASEVDPNCTGVTFSVMLAPKIREEMSASVVQPEYMRRLA
jgi:hypothetical protein